jgi:hypothetical protein
LEESRSGYIVICTAKETLMQNRMFMSFSPAGKETAEHNPASL